MFNSNFVESFTYVGKSLLVIVNETTSDRKNEFLRFLFKKSDGSYETSSEVPAIFGGEVDVATAIAEAEKNGTDKFKSYRLIIHRNYVLQEGDEGYKKPRS